MPLMTVSTVNGATYRDVKAIVPSAIPSEGLELRIGPDNDDLSDYDTYVLTHGITAVTVTLPATEIQ